MINDQNLTFGLMQLCTDSNEKSPLINCRGNNSNISFHYRYVTVSNEMNSMLTIPTEHAKQFYLLIPDDYKATQITSSELQLQHNSCITDCFNCFAEEQFLFPSTSIILAVVFLLLCKTGSQCIVRSFGQSMIYYSVVIEYSAFYTET